MAQSVWMAVPSRHAYKVVDITDRPGPGDTARLEDIATADNGAEAIRAAVKAANAKQRRVSSVLRFNMDILLIID